MADFCGFHSWTLDEVRQFEKRHKAGSKARLALALLLYTGQPLMDRFQNRAEPVHVESCATVALHAEIPAGYLAAKRQVLARFHDDWPLLK
jgi:hypothetical protein